MINALTALPPLLAIAAFLAAAVVARRGSLARALTATRAAGLLAIGCSIAWAMLLPNSGATTSATFDWQGLGIAFRLDALSVVMVGLVAFVGHLVLEFSRNYLAGNPRQGDFVASLALVLAASIALAAAGNLFQLVTAWVTTSLVLHRLLLFFGDRPRARAAARKKFLSARLGDVCVAVAAFLLWRTLGTADIGAILAAAPTAAGDAAMQTAAVLLAVAALLKSAQFPTHGWLTEVMETPTPVSALLHAGIVNAGGFLLFRFADVLVLSPEAMRLLVIVGGFTALFGSLAMSSQTSIKTHLGYSTVGQMGFMLLQCGLGAFSSAGLHLVAHSLYKAHSFLASGTGVEQVSASRAADGRPAASLPVVTGGLLIALAVYAGIGQVFDHGITRTLAVQALGAIFIMGLVVMLARGAGSAALLLRLIPVAGVVAMLYFLLQIGAARFFAALLPPVPAFDALDVLLVAAVLAGFALVSLMQLRPQTNGNRWYRALYVHLRNDLYTNAAFNRLTGVLRRHVTT